MNLDMQNLEDRFLDGLKEVSLPSTLNVIYQEGILGNHILFSREDVRRFENPRLDSRTLKPRKDLISAEEVLYQLMITASFDGMKSLVNKCDFATRKEVFVLYRRFIYLWSDHLKKSLH